MSQWRPERNAARNARRAQARRAARNWMCGPCWQGVEGDGETPPRCPNCGQLAQLPHEVREWTDEEWSARTGHPASERGGRMSTATIPNRQKD